MPDSLPCGCRPLAGGGMVSLCHAGHILWLGYLDAIESDPADRPRWRPLEVAYLIHTHQAEATA